MSPANALPLVVFNGKNGRCRLNINMLSYQYRDPHVTGPLIPFYYDCYRSETNLSEFTNFPVHSVWVHQSNYVRIAKLWFLCKLLFRMYQQAHQLESYDTHIHEEYGHAIKRGQSGSDILLLKKTIRLLKYHSVIYFPPINAAKNDQIYLVITHLVQFSAQCINSITQTLCFAISWMPQFCHLVISRPKPHESWFRQPIYLHCANRSHCSLRELV